MISGLMMIIRLAESISAITKKDFSECLIEELFLSYPLKAIEIAKSVNLQGLEKSDILPIVGAFFEVNHGCK